MIVFVALIFMKSTEMPPPWRFSPLKMTSKGLPPLPAPLPQSMHTKSRRITPEPLPARRNLGLKKLLENSLLRVLLVRKILLLNDGRDKIMKVAQYSAKVLLWLVLLEKSVNQTRAKQIASHFSIVRKVIRLGHFLEPFNDGLDILKEAQFETLAQKLAPLNVLIGIANDISDDIICLSKLGVLDKDWTKTMTPYSDRLWYSSIFIDIHSNWTETNKWIQKYDQESDMEQKQKLSQKIFMARISLIKLLADFVFCTVDVFELGDRVSPGWQNLSGLLAALLGTYKLSMKL
jgi:hypothetical protein